MSNIFFQGATVNVSSGTSIGVYAPIDRVQSVQFSYNIPRTDIRTLGRFKPLPDRPVINYTPVSMSVSYIKGDKNVETCLGLLNSTGLAILIGNGTQVTDWGLRTYPVYLSPVTLLNNVGEFDVVSGALRSFSLAGAVNEPVRGSFSVDALDLWQTVNNNAKTTPNYSGQVIRSQDIVYTGIDFTGLGYSGLIIQSFSFGASFDYASHIKLGTQFPVKRMINGNATLQLEAYIDGTTNTVATLNQYQCGSYITGTYVFTLQPSCVGNQTPTTITMQNPYIETQTVGVQVGNFIQVSLGFSVPLTTVAFEATGAGMGPNCTIT